MSLANVLGSDYSIVLSCICGVKLGTLGITQNLEQEMR